MVLTHTNEDQTKIAIERIRSRFASEKFQLGQGGTAVTASFGVAGFSGKKLPDFNLLLAHADAALYAAKNKGRNRVEFHSDAL